MGEKFQFLELLMLIGSVFWHQLFSIESNGVPDLSLVTLAFELLFDYHLPVCRILLSSAHGF